MRGIFRPGSGHFSAGCANQPGGVGAKAIAEGKIKMNLSDLDRLVRLESFLDQGVDSRHEVIIESLKGKSFEELRGMLRSEIESLKKLEEDCADPLLLEDESMAD